MIHFLDEGVKLIKGNSLGCVCEIKIIEIALEDQDKTMFMCPFGTFAYRYMPFGLCNASRTFQR